MPIRDRFARTLVPFHLNHNQKIVLRKLQELQRKKKLLRLIVLKARRVGISSLTDALMVTHCLASDGKKAMIVSHEYKSSAGLIEVPMNLVTKAVTGQPTLQSVLGIPAPNKHEIRFPFPHGESTLEIATAGNLSGGRGLSLSFLHLSEAARYGGIESFGALLPTVPRDPETCIVIESTANGRAFDGELFYDYWCDAVERQSEFVPVFIPWMDDPTCVADPHLADDAPVDDEERMLIKEFKCSKSQLAWRRVTLNTECKGYLPLFHQEYPHTADSAFISTGDPAFDQGEVAYAESTVTPPEYCGALHRGASDTPEFEATESGLLKLWRKPLPNHHYYVGADAARGTDEGDFAAIIVWDGDTGEQCASYAERINPEVLADMCDMLGRYYNKAMVNIELTGNLGLWAQSVLRDRHKYSNLYRWRGRDDRIRDVKARSSIGWETTMRTRVLAMDAYRCALREKRLTVYDEALLQQMERATRKDGMRWDVERGHDDLLMAALVGWIAREQWAPPRSLGGYRPDGGDDEIQNLTWRDDVQTSLIKHFRRVQSYMARKGRTDPLEGV